MKRGITVIFSLLLLLSCIKEDLTNCPNWGKYRISLLEGEQLLSWLESNYSLYLLYQSHSNRDRLGESSYTLESGDNRYREYEALFLAPNRFTFYSLLTNSTIFASSSIRGGQLWEQGVDDQSFRYHNLKNGEHYLYCKCEVKIEKESVNIVTLHHTLLNAIIVLNPIISATSKIDILQFEITPPNQSECRVDLLNGHCSRESRVSTFYEKCLFNPTYDRWYYPTNPLISGSEVTIRTTLFHRELQKEILLYSKLFLPMGLIGGKIHTITLSVTPNEVYEVSQGVEDWEEIYSDINMKHKP